MRKLLLPLTDWVTSKSGMLITIIAWLVLTLGLFIFAPSAKEYDVSSIQTLPEDADSIIATKELNKYFNDDQGIPALLVFSSESGEVDTQIISSAMDFARAWKFSFLPTKSVSLLTSTIAPTL